MTTALLMPNNLLDLLPNDCMEIIQLNVLESSCDDIESEFKEIVEFLIEIVKQQFCVLKKIRRRRTNFLSSCTS